jgi:uncharacterized protein (TIGR02246 family)
MERFSEHLRKRDVEALLALYESEAVFITACGEMLSGHAQIRDALRRLAALEPLVALRVSQVLSAGATTLVVNDWSMSRFAADGAVIRDAGSSAMVLRRQADGGWLILIDHP